MAEGEAHPAEGQATPATLATQIRRRRSASERLEPYNATGDFDPLAALCAQPDLVTDRDLDAWATAVVHVRRNVGVDVLELLPLDVRRGLWRRHRHLWPERVA